MSVSFIAGHVAGAMSGSYGWGTLAGLIAGTASTIINLPADDNVALSLNTQPFLALNASLWGTISALGAAEGSPLATQAPSAALPLSILISGAVESTTPLLSAVGLNSIFPPDTTYQLRYPDTENVIAHLLYGLSRTAISYATAKVITAATVAAQPITGKAVLWLTGNAATAITAGAIAPALILSSSLVSLFYLSIKYSPNINENIYKFASSTASWLTMPLDWHLIQLRAKAVFGLLTAAEINNLDNFKLELIGISLSHGLRKEEIYKLNERAWQFLPVDTKEKFISQHSSTPRVESLNERADNADNNEPLRADEINQLGHIETYGLSPEVFNNLADDELSLLSPHVLNHISDLTLVQLETRVPLRLSIDALAGLRPYFLNNFSIDLSKVFIKSLPAEKHQLLSAEPVRWQSGIMPEPNIKTPTFVDKVKNGERMYWVEKIPYTY